MSDELEKLKKDELIELVKKQQDELENRPKKVEGESDLRSRIESLERANAEAHKELEAARAAVEKAKATGTLLSDLPFITQEQYEDLERKYVQEVRWTKAHRPSGALVLKHFKSPPVRHEYSVEAPAAGTKSPALPAMTVRAVDEGEAIAAYVQRKGIQEVHKRNFVVRRVMAALIMLACFAGAAEAQILRIPQGEGLTAVMSGAATTTNPTYFVERSSGITTGSLSGATAVTLGGRDNAEDAIDSISFYNSDTTTATITLTHDTATDVIITKVALPTGSTWRWDDNGIKVLDSAGQLQQGTTSIGGVGAAAGTGVVATESGFGDYHETLLTLTNVSVTMTDEAGTICYGGLKIYDFPEGAIQVMGAVIDVNLTEASAGINADWDGDTSLGSVTAANDADLTSTEADLIAKTATPQAATSATTGNAQSSITQAGIVLDGTTTAKDAFLNYLIDDLDQDGGGALVVNGTIKIKWRQLGDY